MSQQQSDGVKIKELDLNVQTLRELTDKTSSVAGRTDCTQDTNCNCNIWWSYKTYNYWCCDC